MQFLITGPLRFALLIMEWIFVFFMFELGLLFLIKYKKQSFQLKNSQDLGFFTLSYGFSLMRFFFLLSGYYSSDNIISPFFIWSYGSFKNLFLNFGALSIITGTLIFTFFVEKNKKFLFKGHFFTICFLIELLICLIIFLISVELINILLIILMPLFLLFFIIYSKEFDKKVKNQEFIPRGGLKLIIILLLIIGGFVLSMDIITNIFSLISRLIGIILQLIAIGLIFIFFRKIPPLFELDWQDKIEDIYILNKDGLCLFNKSYIDKNRSLSSHYISGVLSSVNIMLNELIPSKSNEISTIKKKGKIITTFSSNYITGILISKEELEYFKYNLKKLILKLEEIYKSILINWNGDLTIFYPVKNIIESIFSFD
ncbi:MAG: hypothetical protein ACFFHD_02660 [Promethearchaeota archaeon]